MSNASYSMNPWLGSMIHFNSCKCERCKHLHVNGYAPPKTALELHYEILSKIEKENTR